MYCLPGTVDGTVRKEPDVIAPGIGTVKVLQVHRVFSVIGIVTLGCRNIVVVILIIFEKDLSVFVC